MCVVRVFYTESYKLYYFFYLDFTPNLLYQNCLKLANILRLINESCWKGYNTLDNQMKSEEAKKIGFRTTEKHLWERFTDSQLLVFLFPFHSLTIFLPAIWHSEKNVTRDDPLTTPSSPLFVPICVCLSVSLDCLEAKRLACDTTKANDKKETKKTERETRFRRVAKSDDGDDNALFGSSYSATQKRSVLRGHNVLLFIPEYTCAFRELARPLVQIFLFHSPLFFPFFFFTFSLFNPSMSLVLSRPFHSYTENVFSNLCTPFSPF